MDANIGAKERVTQNRLIGLFKNVLKYTYLGNWETREDNANIEEKVAYSISLAAWLYRQGDTECNRETQAVGKLPWRRIV